MWLVLRNFYFRSRLVQLSLILLNGVQIVLLLLLVYTVPTESTLAQEPVPNLSISASLWTVVAMSSFFIIDLVLTASIHQFTLSFFLSRGFWVALTTCAPFLLAFLPRSSVHFLFVFPQIRVLKWIDIFRMSEYLRISRENLLPTQWAKQFNGESERISPFLLSEFAFATLKLLTYIVAYLLVTSSAVYILDFYAPNSFQNNTLFGSEDEPSLQVFTAFYFVVITLTTIGYGDVTPVSWPGQLLTVVAIFAGLSWIPSQVAEVLDSINSVDVLTIKEFHPAEGLGKFVVVIGRVEDHFFLTTLEEILHQYDLKSAGIIQGLEQGETPRVVFLSPVRPSAMQASVLMLYKKKITFLVGSSLRAADLMRCKCHLALSIVVLSELLLDGGVHERFRGFGKRHEEDHVFLSCLGVLRFLAKHKHPSRSPRLLVKLTASARGSLTLRNSGVDLAFRQQELMLSALALCACIPGSLQLLHYLADSVKIVGVQPLPLNLGTCEISLAKISEALLLHSTGSVVLIAAKRRTSLLINPSRSTILISECQCVFLAAPVSAEYLWSHHALKILLTNVINICAAAVASNHPRPAPQQSDLRHEVEVGQLQRAHSCVCPSPPPPPSQCFRTTETTEPCSQDRSEGGLLNELLNDKNDDDDDDENNGNDTAQDEAKNPRAVVGPKSRAQKFSARRTYSSRSLNPFQPFVESSSEAFLGEASEVGQLRSSACSPRTTESKEEKQDSSCLSPPTTPPTSTATHAQNQQHLIILYLIPDLEAWALPHNVLLPLLVFLRSTRKLTSDKVVVLTDRIEELVEMIPHIHDHDPTTFANVELVKGNPRHVAHLHQIGAERAKSIAIIRMPGLTGASSGTIGGEFLHDDKDVLIVVNILANYLRVNCRHGVFPHLLCQLNNDASATFMPVGGLLCQSVNTSFLDLLFCRSIVTDCASSSIIEFFAKLFEEPWGLGKWKCPTTDRGLSMLELRQAVMNDTGRLLLAVQRENEGVQQWEGVHQWRLNILPGDDFFALEPGL